MKQLSLYLKSALYNIRRNKAYAIFCIGGTTLTFIFLTIILQFTDVLVKNTAPAVHADHIMCLDYWKKDRKGQSIIHLNTDEINNLMKYVKGYQSYAIMQMQPLNLIINEQIETNIIYFVNADYWKIHRFNFIEGHPFTEKDYHTPVVVITKNCAKRYFKNGSAINQNIDFQGNTFKVIGVVDDFSMIALTDPSSMWVPYTYNQFSPNQTTAYQLYILFPEQFTREQMNENIADALRFYNQQRDCEIDIPIDLYPTLQEKKQTGNMEFLPFAIFFLLMIPAINIITLSIANVNNRAEEIGIRRVMGANRISSFLQIITENLVLVFTGTFLGILLVYPILHYVNNLLQNMMPVEGFSLLPGLSAGVIILEIIPLSILFSLLSVGLPTYLIIRRNITDSLKGGSKC